MDSPARLGSLLTQGCIDEGGFANAGVADDQDVPHFLCSHRIVIDNTSRCVSFQKMHNSSPFYCHANTTLYPSNPAK